MFQRVWDEEKIRSYILGARGVHPLNSHYISTNHSGLYAASVRLYGSWRNAVEAVGLNYRDIRLYREWTNEGILDAIHKMDRHGSDLTSKGVQLNDKALYMAALHRFRSWGRAIKAAGLNYRDIRQRRSMSPDEIKAAIIALYESGEDLAYSPMRARHQFLLAAGMKKLGHGSWQVARRKCGIHRNFRLGRYKFHKSAPPKLPPEVMEQIKSVEARLAPSATASGILEAKPKRKSRA
ncbi:MAG: hypothetical protein IJJ33_16470 [Victivallales bacterium]|nr:hypothetical protein [Victivallales bacterium]